MTYVYKHTFPDGKIYIGIANNYLSRWNDGKGYSDNPPMYEAIKQYGWDNIKHEILKECDTRHEAEQLEQRLILAYHSENEEIGYNRTRFTLRLLEMQSKVVEKKQDEYTVRFKGGVGKTNNEKLLQWFIVNGYVVGE